MAANLVRLAEGKDTVGIKIGDFAKAVSWDAKTGVLEIKDHAQFNQIVAQLENHADGLWDKGVLQKGAVAELNNIEKGTWQKIIHAQGLDKAGEIETGIDGHDEITPEQITDFEKSEMVQEAEKAIAEAEKAAPAETVEESEKLKKLKAIDRMKELRDKLGIPKEPVEGAGEVAKEELPPITPERLAKAKSTLLEQGFKSSEVDLILEKKLTIGKLLKEFPEGANKTEMYQEKLDEIDVPWDGQRGYGEFNRYWKLAERIREELPLINKSPEGKEMTIGEYFGKVGAGVGVEPEKVLPAEAPPTEKGVNVEI